MLRIVFSDLVNGRYSCIFAIDDVKRELMTSTSVTRKEANILDNKVRDLVDKVNSITSPALKDYLKDVFFATRTKESNKSLIFLNKRQYLEEPLEGYLFNAADYSCGRVNQELAMRKWSRLYGDWSTFGMDDQELTEPELFMPGVVASLYASKDYMKDPEGTLANFNDAYLPLYNSYPDLLSKGKSTQQQARILFNSYMTGKKLGSVHEDWLDFSDWKRIPEWLRVTKKTPYNNFIRTLEVVNQNAKDLTDITAARVFCYPVDYPYAKSAKIRKLFNQYIAFLLKERKSYDKEGRLRGFFYYIANSMEGANPQGVFNLMLQFKREKEPLSADDAFLCEHLSRNYTKYEKMPFAWVKETVSPLI